MIVAYFFSLARAVTRKSFKILTVKLEKHNGINLLPQSSWDSLADIISRTMQDREISSMEFHKVLQGVEKYRKVKVGIINHAKTKVKHITKNSKKNYLNKDESKAKSFSYKKLKILEKSKVSFSTLQHVVILPIKTIKLNWNFIL